MNPYKGQLRFVIRMRGDRHVRWGDETLPMEDVAKCCLCPHVRTIEIEKNGERQMRSGNETQQMEEVGQNESFETE